jgi:hypothetical protein
VIALIQKWNQYHNITISTHLARWAGLVSPNNPQNIVCLPNLYTLVQSVGRVVHVTGGIVTIFGSRMFATVVCSIVFVDTTISVLAQFIMNIV